MGSRSSEDTTVATTVCAHKESKRETMGTDEGWVMGKRSKGKEMGLRMSTRDFQLSL